MNIVDEVTLELDALVELRACSRASRNRVIAKLLTPAGQAEALKYRRNGMRISEVADLLITLSRIC